MPSPILLLVGLGNPGPQYLETRHNAGFWLVDRLAARLGERFQVESKFHGEVCRIRSSGIECRLLKPLTFMNRSGQSVAGVVNYFKIPPEQILVAHDELDLPAGVVRLKKAGGHAGHNGLRDIVSAIGSSDFWRVRIGIGRPESGRPVADYVLGRASRDDAAAIEQALAEVEENAADILAGEFQAAMRHLHSAAG